MKIIFVTTGDIKDIATAKRALGMANPLVELGWDVSILMEDTDENRHRVSMECRPEVRVHYFPVSSVVKEIKIKNQLIKELNPDYIYVCAFVARNMVGFGHHCKKLVEHSELQSSIPERRGIRRIIAYASEYLSIFYADALLNASKFLQDVYQKRAKKMLKGKLPMMYFPYAYSSGVLKVQNIDRTKPEYAKYRGRKIFVFLGSIVRGYGAFTMIEAIKDLKNKHSEVLLLMLGRGTDYTLACDYVQKFHLEDNIELPGYVSEEDISFYFSLADYFISPMNDTVQDWARCPSKLYMYLPYKKPIVTCRIGEPFHVLANEGYYFKPSSSHNLAEVMDALIVSGKKEIRIDPLLHEWKHRTEEFDEWIRSI